MALSPAYREVSDTDLSQALFNKIPCPNMRTGIRMGLLNPDSQGWVATTEIRAYLEYIGIDKNSKVEDLLIITGERAPEEKKEGYINLTAFAGTFLDHGSSSGILNNPEGFLENRLELLLSYADDQGRFYKKNLGLALNDFHQCPFREKKLVGTNILSFEFAGLLEIYGRTDETNTTKYFTQEDVIDLWKHNRFPETWQAPPKTFCGTWQSFVKYLSMIAVRIRIGWWNTGKPKNQLADDQQAEQ